MFFDWPTLKKLIWLRGAGIVAAVWQTIRNVAVASFTAVSAALRELVIDVTPQQSGSGDPSPTNVRPISGWTGASINVARKNLLSASIVQGGIGSSGETTSNAARCRSEYNPVKPGEIYTVSVEAGLQILAVHFYAGASYRTWISRIVIEAQSGRFTVPPGTGFVRVLFAKADRTQNITPSEITQAQLELGGTATAYAPYIGAVYPVSWETEAGTVHGGTLTDNGNGTWTLTATHGIVTYDGAASETWTAASAGNGYYIRNDMVKRQTDYTNAILCDKLKTVGKFSDLHTTEFAVSAYSYGDAPTHNWIYIITDSSVSSASDLVAWLALNPITIVYELAAPQTCTLTAESVRALIGQNNVFADCGNINTLTYRES